MVNTVFEFKEIVGTYDAASAAGSCEIQTDMPSWGVRQTVALPTTSGGRGTFKQPLAFEGINVKVKFTAGAGASAVLKPYEAHLKVRQIGLYLSNSEAWDTGEFSVNV